MATFLETPAIVQAPPGETIGQVTHTGELHFDVSTDEPGMISFQAGEGDAVATFDLSGQTSTLNVATDSGPVSYTCSATELTQSAAGYEAVFTRAA